MPNQARIFKFLWRDKCWHEFKHPLEDMLKLPVGKWHCKRCGEYVSLTPNPDFTTPDGMVMILERLVEMGYEWMLDYIDGGYDCSLFKGPRLDIEDEANNCVCLRTADTPPLAVIAAVESLIEKEKV